MRASSVIALGSGWCVPKAALMAAACRAAGLHARLGYADVRFLQPVFAGLFALLLASVVERDYTRDISWFKMGCALMIVMGVWLVSRPQRAQ
jgi:transglutaminase-like putative cysteine protease